MDRLRLKIQRLNTLEGRGYARADEDGENKGQMKGGKERGDGAASNIKISKDIQHPSPEGRREGEKKRRPKEGKTKKKHRPDFTRCDAEWSGKNAHSFRFGLYGRT